MMKFKFILFLFFVIPAAFSQSSGIKKVLFLGNSYTYVNDLPGLTRDLAASNGDTLEINSNTPGGYTLQLHSVNAISTMMIQFGDWDYVVLQEQSQIPSFPIAEVDTLCFPYAKRLDSLIVATNPCAETMFYQTWGRKNGDASNCPTWPPVCTYAGMDSLLRLRYRMMADSNHAVISPVGALWHYIRVHYPSIELYAADESHPSEAGTYAAACAFYTAIFKKDPLNIPYDFTLNTVEAGVIRLAAQKVVYDSLWYWNIGPYEPHAGFIYNLFPDFLVEFVNTSQNANHFYWDFGDGTTSYSPIVTHQYPAPGNYSVKLVASHCYSFDTAVNIVNVLQVGLPESSNQQKVIQLYPNPCVSMLYISGLNENGVENTVQVLDQTASLVLEKSTKGDCIQLDVSMLIPGIYEVIINSNEKYQAGLKFVKR